MSSLPVPSPSLTFSFPFSLSFFSPSLFSVVPLSCISLFYYRPFLFLSLTISHLWGRGNVYQMGVKTEKSRWRKERGLEVQWAYLPLPCYREKCCVWLCIICPRWTVGRNVGISGSRAVLSLTQTHLAFHSSFAIYDLCHLWQVLYPF